MALTQMNTRIDDELKKSGDAVFASLGMTPSDVVRAVWEYASRNGDAPAIVAEAMRAPSSAARTLENSHRARLAQAACNFVAEYRESRDAQPPDKLEVIDYEAMRADAWAERLGERGLV